MKKILIFSFFAGCIHFCYGQQKTKVEKLKVEDKTAPAATTPIAHAVTPTLSGGPAAKFLTAASKPEISVPPVAVVVAPPLPEATRPAQVQPATPEPAHPQ